MFTLIYIKNQFNRPDSLLPFLQNSIGQRPLIRIDCVTPYQGTPQDLINDVCDYLSSIEPKIGVTYCALSTKSTVTNNQGITVEFLEIQIKVQSR